MVKQEYVCQCRLIKDNKKQTAWIDERGAIRGAKVELKSDNNEIWEVDYVGARALKSYIQERSQDYKRTRKASDL